MAFVSILQEQDNQGDMNVYVFFFPGPVWFWQAWELSPRRGLRLNILWKCTSGQKVLWVNILWMERGLMNISLPEPLSLPLPSPLLSGYTCGEEAKDGEGVAPFPEVHQPRQFGILSCQPRVPALSIEISPSQMSLYMPLVPVPVTTLIRQTGGCRTHNSHCYIIILVYTNFEYTTNYLFCE